MLMLKSSCFFVPCNDSWMWLNDVMLDSCQDAYWYYHCLIDVSLLVSASFLSFSLCNNLIYACPLFWQVARGKWKSEGGQFVHYGIRSLYNSSIYLPQSGLSIIIQNSTCKQLLSASLYVSKRGTYWDRLCRDVVGWLSRACTVAKRCILGL